MSSVRAMAVAGQFYPDDPRSLHQMVDGFLDQGLSRASQQVCPKVIIVPHAGLRYSGATAAKAYSRLSSFAHQIRRVVMIGPSHRVGFRGIAFEPASQVETPFGLIDVDHAGLESLERRGLVEPQAQAHQHEHCLEVQWPFLQSVLDDFKITPLVTGDTSRYEVAEVLASLWGGDETLIVISTDLSHFHPASECEQIDAHTCAKVTALHSDLNGQQACGCKGLNGLLYLAESYHLRVEQLGYSHSGHTGGPQDRVVGYGAFAVELPEGFDLSERLQLSARDKQRLLKLARESIASALGQTEAKGFDGRSDFETWPAHLMFHGASFVSLHIDSQLRGCIGSLEAHEPLVENIKQNSVKAAFSDPRFPPLTPEELDQLEIEISVLTSPEALICDSEQDCIRQLTPNVDGVILESGRHRATFLPLVWRSLSEPEVFIKHLKQKAGLPLDAWPDDMRVWKYRAVSFAEK